jgi:transcriptional regulator GlxA family with amidase domain
MALGFHKGVIFLQEKAMSRRIGFVLIPGFALMSTAAAMEPLRAANLFAPAPLYDIVPMSVAGGAVRSSLPAAIDTAPLSAGPFDIVFVVAGGDPLAHGHRRLDDWLRRLAGQGVALGGISGGAAVLAQAGLMANRRFTVHWHHLDAVRALTGPFAVDRRLYVIDRDRFTCAGGTAPLDMMQAIIAADHGAGLARRVADWFIQTEIRAADAPQQARGDPGPLSPPVREALDLMDSHLADPLALAQLAALVALSPRQLQRRFRAEAGATVMGRYRALRLDRARDLLTGTRLPVGEIAAMTGFASPAHLSAAFAARFGQPPRSVRA